MRTFNSILQSFFALIALCALTSCALYQPAKVAQQHSCYQLCAEKCKHCRAVCDQDPLTCNAKADAMAAVHFNQYRRQQRIQGLPMTEELQSFRDPLACMKTTCNCAVDYRVCRQACRGTISKRLQKITRFH
ncbi:MAG TPA: hypothetical protein VHD33_04985 [Legionellaceae bacterium]|nr:hypothetical protein [Legionellaceae bacterium]